MDSSVYAILGMVIYIIFAWPYIRSLWKKDVIFHPYSWFLWVILGSINAYVLWNQENIWSFVAQALSIIFWCIFCIYGFITSKKLSLNWIDSLCIGSGVIALIILMIFGLTKAIIAIIFVDIIAIIPTWKKIYINPKSDKIIPWFGSIATLSLYLTSIENWTFESTTFWIYLILVNTTTGFYLLYKKYSTKSKKKYNHS